MTTTTNDKLRSLFLAALMVFSVFAMTVALPGSAAANHDDGDLDYDQELDSGTTFWQGQELAFDDENNEDLNNDYELREFDADGDNNVGTLIEQFPLNDDGTYVLDTSDLDGEYVVEHPNGEFLVIENGHVTGTDDTAEPTSAAFEITQQNLDAEFEDDNVTDEDGDVELELDSNRGTYDLNISADGDLDTDELQDIFVNEENDDSFDSDDVNVHEDDDTITVESVSDGTYSTNFTDIDTGEYTVDFEVTDTSASSSQSVNVSEAAEGDIQFANDVPQDEVGDIADITLEMDNTDEGTITIGSEEQNYWIVARFTDEDDDGEVTIQFNSYTAGAQDLEGETVTADGDDEVNSIVEQGGSFSHESYESGENSDYTYAAQSLLDATEYDMNVTAGHNDGEDADEVGSLSLRDRSTDNLTIMTTPSDFSDWEEDVIVAGLGSNVTQTDEVATGDYAVVQVEASGLEGYLESAGETDFLTGNATTLVVEEADPGANADAESIELDSEDVEVVADADNNSYYVAMPSDADDFEETEYTAEFTVYDEIDGGDNDGDDNQLNFDSDDEDETAASNFEVVDPEVELDMNEDDLVLVEASDNQTVSGTANVAPGTELRITIESDDSTSPFLTRPEATVQPDGTYNASADFSDLGEGTNLTLSISDYDVEEDGQVVAEGELGDGEDGNETETPTEEPDTDTPTEEPDTDTPTEEPDTETDTPTPTDDEGPGFTVIAALGALIAAALLAVRRNN